METVLEVTWSVIFCISNDCRVASLKSALSIADKHVEEVRLSMDFDLSAVNRFTSVFRGCTSVGLQTDVMSPFDVHQESFDDSSDDTADDISSEKQ